MISLVATTAAGGPTNPVGIAVFAVSVALSFLPIGAGRTEADHLTDPGVGAQKIVERDLAQLIDVEYEPQKLAGQLTEEYIDSVIGAIEKIRDDFFDYAKQFPRAGPGAIATIRRVTDRLIRDRQLEKEALRIQQQEREMELPYLPETVTTGPPSTPARNDSLLIGGLLVTVILVWAFS